MNTTVIGAWAFAATKTLKDFAASKDFNILRNKESGTIMFWCQNNKGFFSEGALEVVLEAFKASKTKEEALAKVLQSALEVSIHYPVDNAEKASLFCHKPLSGLDLSRYDDLELSGEEE